jgi:hypothetical protein
VAYHHVEISLLEQLATHSKEDKNWGAGVAILFTRYLTTKFKSDHVRNSWERTVLRAVGQSRLDVILYDSFDCLTKKYDSFD